MHRVCAFSWKLPPNLCFGNASFPPTSCPFYAALHSTLPSFFCSSNQSLFSPIPFLQISRWPPNSRSGRRGMVICLKQLSRLVICQPNSILNSVMQLWSFFTLVAIPMSTGTAFGKFRLPFYRFLHFSDRKTFATSHNAPSTAFHTFLWYLPRVFCFTNTSLSPHICNPQSWASLLGMTRWSIAIF